MFYTKKVINSLKDFSSLKDPRRITGVLFLKIHFIKVLIFIP
ncbi:hypothetical protein LEP1GSC191_2542 [Leptospira borgpetersenii serovar Mini str. 201000851]|uniref:Uncharacterized protein n=3 Tax=Leptospira borgpetersenii TaxID=174 RepID=M3FCR5_LEPBO|nr:hypothetical protein LEP1GSC128_3592 [Leptospira borgpetersenii str. 200801926]EMF99632.1 hypothetical protein LEP1GSC123_2154 [Leptospira borgpetersenii str. 200701203]EMK14629.1 hypothetical protein LEP1GSC066_3588 [Leptospira sp. serovar Kenya str. Sh9]EMN12056.1 hypothetical protein LEP1GSC055_0794 [Leptospira borgpetersenii str. Brem 307]EMN17533.1 hypothetical protein LEP1GSC056_2792 [Leptospira borgpetersenii str. Brem 328]ENO65076.1 hypothetical protein LEP1GSC191_2542 [Leptospira b